MGQLNANRELYALIVTGAGEKFFSAGADLKVFADGDKARARSMAQHFGRAFEALASYRGVSIAAINGYAMGGGLSAPWPVICASLSAMRRWLCLRPRSAFCPAAAAPKTSPGWWGRAGPSA